MAKKIKSKGGRPKKDEVVYKMPIMFYLVEGKDDDLIDILNSIPKGEKWPTIKKMLETKSISTDSNLSDGKVSFTVELDEESDYDLLNIINDSSEDKNSTIKRMMRSGVSAIQAETDDEEVIDESFGDDFLFV